MDQQPAAAAAAALDDEMPPPGANPQDVLAAIEQRFRNGSLRMTALAKAQAELAEALQRNTVLTEENARLTKEVRDLLELGRAAFKLAGWFAVGLRWLATVGGAAGALYAAYQAVKTGTPPPPKP